MTPQEALERLKSGNERFASGGLLHPRVSEDRRLGTFEKGQKPMAAVLSCADSRSPVELIFDKGIGDIFAVRNAGNVCDETVIGTLEIGVQKFDIPLVVVMAHTDCGAIKLAVDGKPLPGHMPAVIDKIMPVVEMIRSANPGVSDEELIQLATKANALQSVGILMEESDILREHFEARELVVVPAVHNLETGRVEFMH